MKWVILVPFLLCLTFAAPTQLQIDHVKNLEYYKTWQDIQYESFNKSYKKWSFTQTRNWFISIDSMRGVFDNAMGDTVSDYFRIHKDYCRSAFVNISVNFSDLRLYGSDLAINNKATSQFKAYFLANSKKAKAAIKKCLK
jgi:hypothetical protein